MAQQLYYVPGTKFRPSKEVLEECGLDYVSEDLAGHVGTNKGPDGGIGVVISLSLSPGAKDGMIGHYPDAQKWTKCNSGKFWIGTQNDSPPTPKDLQRKELLESHPVKLLDNNDWMVPIARKFDSGMALPESLSLTSEGKVVFEILPKYISFSKRGEDVFNDFYSSFMAGGDERRITTWEEELDIATEALALNYKVSKWELAAFKLISTQNISSIFMAIIDGPTVAKVALTNLEAKKKKSLISTKAG